MTEYAKRWTMVRDLIAQMGIMEFMSWCIVKEAQTGVICRMREKRSNRIEASGVHHLRPRLVPLDGSKEIILGPFGLPCNAYIEEPAVRVEVTLTMDTMIHVRMPDERGDIEIELATGQQPDCARKGEGTMGEELPEPKQQ